MTEREKSPEEIDSIKASQAWQLVAKRQSARERLAEVGPNTPEGQYLTDQLHPQVDNPWVVHTDTPEAETSTAKDFYRRQVEKGLI